MSTLKKRDSLRLNIIRLCKKVKKDQLDSKYVIKAYLDSLETYWEKFQNAQLEVEEVSGTEEIDFQTLVIDEVETLYLNTKSDLCRMLSTVSDANTPEFEATRSGENVQANTSTVNRCELKLPRIELTKFNGNYSCWSSFHDLFTSLIDKNNSLSGAQKLHYLKGNLEGEALQLIRSYQITDSNYNEAWDVLINRYDNKRLIVNSHLKTLFNLNNMHTESATSLRKLVDTASECVRSLTVLGLPTQHWDDVLVYWIIQKLDTESHRQWELHTHPTQLPSWKELVDFLEKRCRALEAVGIPKVKSVNPHRKSNDNHPKSFVSTSEKSCIICMVNHPLYSCPEFIKLPVYKRLEVVRKNSVCFNCINGQHSARDCKSGTCKKCSRRHHTLLHYVNQTNSSSTSSTEASSPAVSNEVQTNIDSHLGIQHNKEILLATAIVKIKSKDGMYSVARALLDSGSQTTFITEKCAQLLRLKRKPCAASVSGVGAVTAGASHGAVEFQLLSCNHNNSFTVHVDALVLPKITNYLPNKEIQLQSWSQFDGIKLADPDFRKPGRIDLLLGADIYGDLILDGIIPGTKDAPMAQNTQLGWVLSGPAIYNERKNNMVVSCLHTDLDKQLRSFWEIEEVDTNQQLSGDEKICESIFYKTHTRDEEGRYIVHLPFKSDNIQLGDSRFMAIKRLLHLEKQFDNDEPFRKSYVQFLDEYLALGHMKLASSVNSSSQSFYLPHHGVRKESSSTTKLRVVFDASAKSSNGTSLNDILHVGPKLQDSLVFILMRFRTNKIAFTGDIAQMYRQILVNKNHLDFQRIVWRRSPEDKIQDYHLKTVTYGMASATFLAVKSLQQLAVDEESLYPEASRTTRNDFYMDDLMSGTNDVQTALAIQQDLISLLSRGGFKLRKWASNCSELLEAVPEDDRECKLHLDIHKEDSQVIKTLGVQWHPASDSFGFKVSLFKDQASITKRSALSDISKLFDPFGLLAPSIILAKIFMQRLWALSIGWDDALPRELQTQWKQYRSELYDLEKIKIPRWYNTNPNSHIEIHGFSDASELAYAAVIYIRVTNESNTSVHLITAKSKVAPLKQISIPRLELCGAVLLTRLLRNVHEALNLVNIRSWLWTDSEIVLAWINKPPRTWATFVANRVSEIQSSTFQSYWQHVGTNQNPADLATRGFNPSELHNCELWWNGPDWLHKSENCWPIGNKDVTTSMEARKERITCFHGCQVLDWHLLHKYSSILRLKRVTAYVLRFINNIRNSKLRNQFVVLNTSELDAAERFWIRYVQGVEFANVIDGVRKNKSVSCESSMAALNPYLDENNILRVGGRLGQSNLDLDQKHQIILPPKNTLTQLIISDVHNSSLHGGVNLMLNILRQKYWIVGARSLLRKFIFKCMVCWRQKKQVGKQIMGNLPAARVIPSRPFLTAGVDFAGPIVLRISKGRSSKTMKGYISVFVCFVTKAVHLEAVSELTSKAFIAAFHRFTARRGRCIDLYSDCGSNFVGARNVMYELSELWKSDEHNSVVKNSLVNCGTNWHFIPAGSPHFGGLWEAAVKSVKHHLRRVIGSTMLNFEELSTLLAEVEACLNSRPLCPLSDDFQDLEALTPAHFLIGEPTLNVSERDYQVTPLNRLDRWQLVQRLNQNFWSRWHVEYLSSLQPRTKWMKEQTNICVGALVLIKDERLPPSKWLLARVTETHPGDDGKVRAVTLKYNTGVTRRTIAKICPLPLS